MARISKKNRVAIENYLEDGLRRLKLSHWHFELNDDVPDDPDATATVNTRRGQRIAGMWLSDKFFNDDIVPDALRTQTLIHEMLHLHFEEAWLFVDSVFENELGRQAKNMGLEAFRVKMEVPIDQLAYVLCDYFPLFRLPK